MDKGSLAEREGLQPGDRIVSVNDRAVGDIIDLTFALSDEQIHMLVRDSLGNTHAHYFQKRFDESLGISMESAVFDHIRQCTNKCTFCFIDQMPRGMRESLYVKDDDYRMSFLYGNFITLTNMNDDDFSRIRRLHLSPLYVSVHTTNGALRQKMMTNPRAAEIRPLLERLIRECGVDVHTQIVLCPHVNDGKELDDTLSYLYSLMPSVLSVAIVPVGLSKFRDRLAPLTAFDEAGARRTIRQVEKWQDRARKEYGRSFVYLGDEFYFTAHLPMPPSAWYDGYNNIEDGIGMVRKFEDDWKAFKAPAAPRLEGTKRIVIPCGTLIGDWLKKVTGSLAIPGLTVEVLPVENDHFGHGVHVTGLLTAEDMTRAIKGLPYRPDGIIIPGVTLRKGEAVFLDDVTLPDFTKQFEQPVKVCDFAADLLETLYQWK